MERKTEMLDEDARRGASFEGLSEAEIFARLEAALKRIPERRRAIFLAVRLGNMSYDEIAERTGLSVKQVEQQLARALMQIDSYLRHGEAPLPRPWWRRFWRR